MILTHRSIQDLIQRGMVEHYDSALMNGTSLDVRLGNVFKVEVPGKDVKEDEYAMLNLGQRDAINTERVELAEGEDAEPFLLFPGQFVGRHRGALQPTAGRERRVPPEEQRRAHGAESRAGRVVRPRLARPPDAGAAQHQSASRGGLAPRRPHWPDDLSRA